MKSDAGGQQDTVNPTVESISKQIVPEALLKKEKSYSCSGENGKVPLWITLLSM